MVHFAPRRRTNHHAPNATKHPNEGAPQPTIITKGDAPQRQPRNSAAWFRSTDRWVMSPTRQPLRHCASGSTDNPPIHESEQLLNGVQIAPLPKPKLAAPQADPPNRRTGSTPAHERQQRLDVSHASGQRARGDPTPKTHPRHEHCLVATPNLKSSQHPEVFPGGPPPQY